MPYFSFFPKTLYSFGDGKVARAQNLAAYAQIMDDIKNNGAFYQQYHIITGERPDQVAFKLYKDPHLYWVLFMINDNLREKGWPLNQQEVLQKAKKDFPDYTIHTHDVIHDKLLVGETIHCNRSGLRADIIYRNLKLGDITVTNLRKLQDGQYVPVAFSPNDIVDGDLITSVETNESITAEYFTPEHLAARYHSIDGELIDYLPFTGEGQNQVRVTNLEYYVQENDKLKEINVLKPAVVNRVVSMFNQAVSS